MGKYATPNPLSVREDTEPIQGPTGGFERFANTPEGIEPLAGFCTHTGGELIVMETSGRYEQLAFLILRPLPNSSLSHPWPMTAENVRASAPSGAAEPMSDRSLISSLTLPENSILLTNQIGAHPAVTRNTLPRGEGVKNHTQPF
jgi:hypothetical protein